MFTGNKDRDMRDMIGRAWPLLICDDRDIGHPELVDVNREQGFIENLSSV